jgi:hypothetical protein
MSMITDKPLQIPGNVIPIESQISIFVIVRTPPPSQLIRNFSRNLFTRPYFKFSGAIKFQANMTIFRINFYKLLILNPDRLID